MTASNVLLQACPQAVTTSAAVTERRVRLSVLTRYWGPRPRALSHTDPEPAKIECNSHAFF